MVVLGIIKNIIIINSTIRLLSSRVGPLFSIFEKKKKSKIFIGDIIWKILFKIFIKTKNFFFVLERKEKKILVEE